MANYTKREQRRQHVIEAMDRDDSPRPAMPLCHCGAPARYEVNRGREGVTFACEKHLPDDF